MSIKSLILPENYNTPLNVLETEKAIKIVKDTFENKLAESLHLTRVSAPLFVDANTGINDNLNGIERPVSFDIKETNTTAEVVHSLAKWKRFALQRYSFANDSGLYADMNAIRRDEDLDNLHSIYVDQWDWEKIITRETRNFDTVKETVVKIVKALKAAELDVCSHFSSLKPFICEDVFFISSQELEDLYPNLDPKSREHKICKKYKTVFISQIGKTLKSGKKHDGRSPDYDDWELNGDILIWYPLLNRSVEISSMGIRVDEESLYQQLKEANCLERMTLPFHSMLLRGMLPLTMGGGIGQSRICMLLLQKAHIGEVQASIWSNQMINICADNNIFLL